MEASAAFVVAAEWSPRLQLPAGGPFTVDDLERVLEGLGFNMQAQAAVLGQTWASLDSAVARDRGLPRRSEGLPRWQPLLTPG